jgi:hypothetical protein
MLTHTDSLFHASLPDVEARIVSEGILLNHQGLVNLSGFASHAAGYVNMFGCSRLEGVRVTQSEPHFIQSFFDRISVFHIDQNQIDVESLVMNDYDKQQSRAGVFPWFCSSFTYPRHIPASAITDVSYFDKNDIRSPLEFYSPRGHG